MDVPFAAKVDLLKEINDFARALDPRVVQAGCRFGWGARKSPFCGRTVKSMKTRVQCAILMCRLSLSRMEDGNQVTARWRSFRFDPTYCI